MIFKQQLINVLNKLPYIRGLYRENLNFKKNSLFRAGHYYSTIISVDEIKEREDEIWSKELIDGVIGINLQTEDQLKLVGDLNQYYAEMPFKEEKQSNLRYFFENGFYLYTDGITLYSMIRHLQPKNIIEVGSGFSSALMLDTNELFFNNQIELTFIEPYPERLYSLMNDGDKKTVKVIEDKVQFVELEYFDKLTAGDILFIDSTHVVKTGSDVNYILFEILPRLKSGVFIHFHDVFYPFEYPREWVFKGWNWNEDYFLRAFLMYNNGFEIKLFSEYLHKHHGEIFEKMPLCYKNHGGNLWIEKK